MNRERVWDGRVRAIQMLDTDKTAMRGSLLVSARNPGGLNCAAQCAKAG